MHVWILYKTRVQEDGSPTAVVANLLLPCSFSIFRIVSKEKKYRNVSCLNGSGDDGMFLLCRICPQRLSFARIMNTSIVSVCMHAFCMGLAFMNMAFLPDLSQISYESIIAVQMIRYSKRVNFKICGKYRPTLITPAENAKFRFTRSDE